MLTEKLSLLPPSEKKIANYILKNPQEAVTLTAAELGKKSNTSGAAVIRLCKSLNVKGFQELKLRIAGDISKIKEVGYSDIEPNESVASVIEKMTNNSIQTIRETAEFLTIKEIENAVEILKKANRIHLVGVGASSIIAQDAQQKFLRINKEAYAFTDLHLAALQVANAKPEDVVIGISFSGKTLEVAKVLQLAKQKNVNTISLTKYGDTAVTEYADIRLYTSATKEPVFRSAATTSRIAQLQVIDILFTCVASTLYDKTIKHLEATREATNFLTGNVRNIDD